jgi:hypothetical protein
MTNDFLRRSGHQIILRQCKQDIALQQVHPYQQFLFAFVLNYFTGEAGERPLVYDQLLTGRKIFRRYFYVGAFFYDQLYVVDD